MLVGRAVRRRRVGRGNEAGPATEARRLIVEPAFWSARWEEGRIGFHEGHVNENLAKHVARLAGSKRILVPLCGKAEDMAFLANQGHEIVGIELSPLAIRAFFDEHGLVAESHADSSGVVVHSAGPYRLLEGDLFKVTPALLGPVDAFYDRAALVALPGDMRASYATHLRTLLGAPARGLVILFEFDQDKFPGPPFSVTSEELRRHFPDATIELLHQGEGRGPRFKEAGVPLRECCYSVALP